MEDFNGVNRRGKETQSPITTILPPLSVNLAKKFILEGGARFKKVYFESGCSSGIQSQMILWYNPSEDSLYKE